MWSSSIIAFLTRFSLFTHHWFIFRMWLKRENLVRKAMIELDHILKINQWWVKRESGKEGNDRAALPDSLLIYF
jgi:ribonuclease HI